MAALLALVLAGGSVGWVTQMQSKFGATPGNIAKMFDGTAPATVYEDVYSALGYYWHFPTLADDNRGLGGGITWAWDDTLCKTDDDAYIGSGKLEDQFKEDFFFARFVTCVDMRAAMHRAFTTWSDAHPLLNFIDVTEECRRVYGAVHSNCSMAEIFITHRDSTGISTSQFDGIKHPKPWPRPDGSEPYPYGKVVDNKFVEGADNVMKCRVVGAIPYIPSGWGEAIDGAACKAASAGLQGMADVANTGLASIGFAPAANALTATTQKRVNAAGSEITLPDAINSLPNWGSARRRALGVDPADDDLDLTVDEGVFASPGRRLQDGFDIGANIGGGTAAASATQYGRYAQDLRSTNGMTQCKTRDAAGGNCTAPFSAIEAYGGIVSFNTEKCWYLDSSFCAPLHGLKASMGKENAHAMVAGIAWGTFGLAALILAMLTIRVMRHQHCCHAQQDMTFKQKFRASAEEASHFGVLPTTILLLCLWVPISMQNNIVQPCWECFDFEAAAVHEIGHILGLNHPDAIAPSTKSDGTTYPEGSNVYSNLTAANDGMVAYDNMSHIPYGRTISDPALTADERYNACLNPWKYVTNGTYPDADDISEDTGVRMSIMYSLTEHNPQVCLTSDDIEGIYTVYPVCDGHGSAVSTSGTLHCYKTSMYIGVVRVLVYILLPIGVLLTLQILGLSCLQHHHDSLVDDLVEAGKQMNTQKEKHKKKAQELEQRAVQIQDALHKQIATEEQRIEERAQEMAAQVIQARIKGNQARHKTSAKMTTASSTSSTSDVAMQKRV